jgi:hypothetical protein
MHATSARETCCRLIALEACSSHRDGAHASRKSRVPRRAARARRRARPIVARRLLRRRPAVLRERAMCVRRGRKLHDPLRRAALPPRLSRQQPVVRRPVRQRRLPVWVRQPVPARMPEPSVSREMRSPDGVQRRVRERGLQLRRRQQLRVQLRGRALSRGVRGRQSSLRRRMLERQLRMWRERQLSLPLSRRQLRRELPRGGELRARMRRR